MTSKYIILWHGTSKSRARSIVRTGFYANSFFTTAVGVAWRYALSRRKQNDPGVLVLCAVDLNYYKKRDYEKAKSGLVYHFIPPAPKNIVAGIFRIDEFAISDLRKETDLLRLRIRKRHGYASSEWKEEADLLRLRIRRHRIKRVKIGGRQPQIVITRNCNEEGIAYWINAYLSTRTDRRIETAHPGIAQISAWVEKNYTNGRISPISDREMLVQIKHYIPGLFRNTRAASMRP